VEYGGTAILLGSPKYILNKALEMGVCFHRATAFREHEVSFFSMAFEERKKFFFQGKFSVDFKREVKNSQ